LASIEPTECRASIDERGELALPPERVAPQYSTIRAQQEASVGILLVARRRAIGQWAHSAQHASDETELNDVIESVRFSIRLKFLRPLRRFEILG
jgi:hypothetical protein